MKCKNVIKAVSVQMPLLQLQRESARLNVPRGEPDLPKRLKTAKGE